MNFHQAAIRTINCVGPQLRRFWAKAFNEDAIIRSAQRATGLTELGDERFRIPLRLILDDYRADTNLTYVGRLIAHGMLTNLVANRIRVHAQIQQVPAVANERIDAPVFVVGLPRSGTTFLYHLLCQDSSFRALMYWETCSPTSPAVGGKKDRRILEARKMVRGLNQALPQLKAIHEFNSDGPDECTGLLLNTFTTPYFRGRLPRFREWLFSVSKDEIQNSYIEYEKQLQVLQLGQIPKPWVLKSPSHLFGLSALLTQFPTARVVYLRRNMEASTASLCSLTHALDTLSYKVSDLHEIGRRTLGIVERLMAGGREALQSRDADRVLVVEYDELTRAPVDTVEAICSRLQLPCAQNIREKVAQFVAANPKDKQGIHKYHLRDYGLSAADLAKLRGLPDSGRSESSEPLL